MKRLLTLLFCCLSFVQFTFAASIKGVVKDAKTGEGIIGAAVMIKGSTTGSVTGVGGEFTIPEAPKDGFVLEVSFISYKTIELTVSPDENTPLVIKLEGEDFKIKEVVVAGRRRSNTESAMVATVKTLPQVASGISAVQIAKSPDRNASEVVRRVPGVTIIDDRFIIVRGLSQRYNNAWINGLAVPSTETDSRAFSFDIIPSSQIDNLIVYKSPTPEVPADFAGGFVQISTKGIPDKNSIEFSYRTGFNANTQFNDFYMNKGSKTDFLGFDLCKRPLPKSFPSHMGSITSSSEITRLTKEGFNNDWSVRKITPVPDQRINFAINSKLNTKSGRAIGNITSINYSNTFKSLHDIQNSRYGIYSSTSDKPVVLDDYRDDQYSNDVRLGAMHNWSFELTPSDKIEFKNLLNILGRNRLTQRAGIKDMSSMYYREQTEMLYSSRLTYTGQLTGTHQMKGNEERIDWSAGYSYANRNEPDRRIVTNQAGIGDLSDIETVETTNDNITRYYQNLNDNIFSGAVNYRRRLGKGRVQPMLRAGVYVEYRNRDYTPREFVYRYDRLSHTERDTYLKLPFQQMMEQQYLGADKVYIDEITKKTNAYSAVVNHQAVYGAVDIPLGALSIYAGVRVENYQADLTRDRSNSPDQTLITTKRTGSVDPLPSINMTYKFNDKHQLRAAYGRSLNRPELREISPSVYYDFDLFSEIGGNENLKTAYIDNVDLRYEFYPSSGEVISIGVFYKHFKNPIEWTFIDMGGSLRYNYENAIAADNMGIELDMRKNLGFMGMPNMFAVVNAALIKSNVSFSKEELVVQSDRPMQGQSPYVINAGLFYQSEKIGLSASLLYNRIGKRIVGIGKSNSINNDIGMTIPDAYEMPRNVLDFTINKRLGKYVELNISVKDILSQDVTFKQFPRFEKDGVVNKREQITRSFNPGQNFNIGISIKI